MFRSLRHAGFGLFLLIGGCNLLIPTTPNEAFLAGTWRVTPTNAGNGPAATYQATFDSTGQLTQLKGTPTAGGAAVTLSTTGSTTTVNGTAITISIPTSGGGAATTFTGTVSSDQNTLTGTLSQTINLGNLNITIPSGGAVWTRTSA